MAATDNCPYTVCILCMSTFKTIGTIGNHHVYLLDMYAYRYKYTCTQVWMALKSGICLIHRPLSVPSKVSSMSQAVGSV